MLFVAADRLDLPGILDAPGAAAFFNYDPALQLTAEGMTRSTWRLPRWFYPQMTCLTSPNSKVYRLSLSYASARFDLRLDKKLSR